MDAAWQVGTDAGPVRNLLIVHTPVLQEISDWITVKNRIDQDAPDIEVRIATNGVRNSATRRWQVSRPSLVFSPYVLKGFEPLGGKIYAGRGFSKLDQIRRLEARGVPVPLTAILTRDLAIDAAQWGPYVVVKPLRGAMGMDVHLLRTKDVAARYGDLTLNDTRAMVIQPYIEHSEDGYPTEYRVLTLFGKVLYAARNSWGAPRGPIEDIADDPKGIIASNDKHVDRVRSVWNETEIIDVGERAHAAFPECPVLGVDIVRNAETRQLFVMEVNPAGDTWHLSSLMAKNFYKAQHVKNLYAQFGALDRVAQLLIEKTRAEAS